MSGMPVQARKTAADSFMNVGASATGPATVASSHPGTAVARIPEESGSVFISHPVRLICCRPSLFLCGDARLVRECVVLDCACAMQRCVHEICVMWAVRVVQATVHGTADTGDAADAANEPRREISAAHAAASAAGAAMAEAAARAEAGAASARVTAAAAGAGGGELAAERERNRMLTQRLGESQTALAQLRSQLAEAKKEGAANGINGKVSSDISSPHHFPT